MVNAKKRDILERYRFLLENNLLLTDELLAWFKGKNGLSELTISDIKAASSAVERNRKFLDKVIDEGDVGFTRLVEGLTASEQPFLGELLESEDKKSADDVTQRFVISDESLKKCPGYDKLRPDAREKVKHYLQDQLVKAHVSDTWNVQNQGRSVEFINLKRQHYEVRQKLIDTVDEEKRNVSSLRDALREEQLVRQQKEEEAKELRSELTRLHSDYEQKWSNQIKMVDATNRTVFSMNDKMTVLAEWFRSLESMLKINILQTGLEVDSIEQLQSKLRRFTTEIESLRTHGIGTDKLKEELYESLYASRSLSIDDRKNQPFREMLTRLFGANQVAELANICTKDVLQSKAERDQAGEIRARDLKIDELSRRNRELQAEIDRLKAKPSAPAAAAAHEHSPPKLPKPVWRPTPSSVTVTPREKPKGRQTLRPIAVQFDTKPTGN